jgi:hypothetical protein
VDGHPLGSDQHISLPGFDIADEKHCCIEPIGFHPISLDMDRAAGGLVDSRPGRQRICRTEGK